MLREGILHGSSNNLGLLLDVIGKTSDPNLPDKLTNQLKFAQLLHREKLCAKNVYAALEIENKYGNVTIYARNGLPRATPHHLKQFNVGKMRNIAMGINSSNSYTLADRQLLSTLNRLPDDQIISCLDLARISGSAYCLKGFMHGNENIRASRSSEEFCPNSIAGCTEKILFYWKPYVLGLQRLLFEREKVGQLDLKILNVQFFNEKDPPLITYQVDNGPIKEYSGYLVLTDGIVNMKQTLFVQTCPCPSCSKKIESEGIDVVAIESLSKYKNGNGNGNLIDGDDLFSLTHLVRNRVEVFCPNVLGKQTVLRV